MRGASGYNTERLKPKSQYEARDTRDIDELTMFYDMLYIDLDDSELGDPFLDDDIQNMAKNLYSQREARLDEAIVRKL
jgi:hypothetical protein